MIIDRIKFTKEFSYHNMSEWLGCEASLDKDEDPIKAILEAREKMVQAFNETLKQQEVPIVQQAKKVTGIDHWLNEIAICTKIENTSTTELDGLEAIRTIADMNPVIKEAFNKKLEQLKNNQ